MANKPNYIGFEYVEPEPNKDILLARYLIVPKPELVEGTGDTKVNFNEKIDLVELTQSYKDECGIEFMLKQMKLGVVAPEQLADDGQHSGDASVIPDNPVDAYQASLKADQTKAALAKQLGIPVEQLTEENISAKVAELFGKVDGKTVEVKKDE